MSRAETAPFFRPICVLMAGLYSFAGPPAWTQCSLTNLGMTPLPELGLSAYQGFSSGLYPNGGNNRPWAHLAAGMRIATNGIEPLNASGNVDTNAGKIVLLSIG